jgi:nucleoside-diphosphate-sugar epimerase
MKNILVTGNLGYIGSTMVPILAEKGYKVTGYDIGYYEDCYLKSAPQKLVKQIKKDVRDVTPEDLAGIDAVIHLAGLSNDPLGEFDATLTDEINHKATIKMAEAAKKAGVKRFLYTSSQSVYGISDTSKDVDENGQTGPITAYAKSKWDSECDLKKYADDSFVITYLRPATAYGASPNQRMDIVFNQFVGFAYVNKKIEIKSDGTPVRPMTHIRDITAAFIACLEAPANLIQNQVFNVGTSDNNYTVKDLAEAAQKCVPGTTLTFTNEDTDPRSYRVTSQKILTVLKDYYKPEWDITKGADELMQWYGEAGLDQETFSGWKTRRIKALQKRIADGWLDNHLRHIGG